MRPTASLLVSTLLLSGIAGCLATPSGEPCDDDEMCGVGRYCASDGVGCTSDCDSDAACSGGAVCDEIRGRCVGGGDAGVPRDAEPDASACRSDGDCDDDVFCNGVERCNPGAGATADGCVGGALPCAGGASCDEATERCQTTCDEDMDGNGRIDADNDGDGHRSIVCGPSGTVPGDDCDDTDANRYPRTIGEVCDDAAPGHDEDCDPCTVADYLADDGDDDRDGFVSETCSNPLREADDPSSFTCPGTINEFTTIRSAERVVTGNDCNDTPGAGNGVDPGVAEICNGFDDNCDGLIDGETPGLVCDCLIGAPARPCGATDVGACAYGTQNCISGRWGECIGAIGPVMEYCGGGDANCNGTADEGLLVDCVVDEDNDYYRTPGGSVTAQCRDGSRPAWGFCPVGYIAPSLSRGDDCAPTDIAAWVYYNVRRDVDGDGYCVGGVAGPRCGGASEPVGYSVSCNFFDDCNDGDPGQSISLQIRTDADGDTFCSGSSRFVCTNGSVPSGSRLSGDCAGDDVEDTNYCARTPATASPVRTCFGGPFACPSPGVYCEVQCPPGFDLSDCTSERLPGSQSGYCAINRYTDACRLTQTCNVFDSSMCRITLTCAPRPNYSGPC